MSTKTGTESSGARVRMVNLAVRPDDHQLAKTAAFVLNKDICDVVAAALLFYLERKSPRTMELYREQKGKVAA